MTAPPSARAQMLARIRAAIAAGSAPPPATDAPSPADGTTGAGSASNLVDAAYAALPREYLRAHHDVGSRDIVALFAERAADYRAVVERVPESGLASVVARVLTARAAVVPGPFLTPDGLPADWFPADWLTAPPTASSWPATPRCGPRPNSTGWRAS